MVHAVMLVWQYQPQSSEECQYEAAMMFKLFTIVSFNSSVLVISFTRRAQLLWSVVETAFRRATAWTRTSSPYMLAIRQATLCQCDNAHCCKSCGRSRMATAQPQKRVPTLRESHWSTTMAVTKALQAISNMQGSATCRAPTMPCPSLKAAW